MNTQTSRAHLSIEERSFIMSERLRGSSCRWIATQLGRSPSTISREVRRGVSAECPSYQARAAQQAYRIRRTASRRVRKLEASPALWSYVRDLLQLYLSPQQIAGRLRAMFSEDPAHQVSHETIYAYIYAQPRGGLRKELIAHLRQHHKTRRRRSQGEDRRGQIVGMRSIHDRPLEIEGRTVPGHWEGDLIKGAFNRSAVGTLVERTSRYVLLAKMEGTDAQSALEGFTRILRHVPRCMRQTLTYDQGKEMAKHQDLAKRLQIDVYFADPHSPWQRGSNENINGLIRQFLPKGMDLSEVSQRTLNRISLLLNIRPRAVLNFQNPLEVYSQMIEKIQNTQTSTTVALES